MLELPLFDSTSAINAAENGSHLPAKRPKVTRPKTLREAAVRRDESIEAGLAPFASFYRDAKSKDGRVGKCKACWPKDSAKERAAYLRRRERKLLSVAQYKQKHPEKIREKDRQYRKKNRPRLNRQRADYLAAQLQAQPAWASVAAIDAAYESADYLTRLTGVSFEVDHVVPLRGKTVCGLHIAANLEPIPAVENRRKCNRLIA